MDRPLLRRFLEVYPFQPATAVWRASEVAELAQVAFPAGRGLDLGCGDGRLTRVLSDLTGGLRLVGLDIDPMETALAVAGGFYERVHTSPAESIPEPDASFDFVVSISVMEHIPNLEPVLRDVARVLKPQGHLIITVPGPGFHACLHGPRGSLEAAGLTLVEAKPILSRSDVRRWETISRLTAGVLHAISRGKPPIDIQRSLGLRQPGQRIPASFARVLGGLLAIGLDERAPCDERESGCLLVIAKRNG
jgi:SAM-dependent methyltransferase